MLGRARRHGGITSLLMKGLALLLFLSILSGGGLLLLWHGVQGIWNWGNDIGSQASTEAGRPHTRPRTTTTSTVPTTGLLPANELPPLRVAVHGLPVEGTLGALAALGGRSLVLAAPADLVVSAGRTARYTAATAASPIIVTVPRQSPAQTALQIQRLVAPLMTAAGKPPAGRSGPSACAGLVVSVDPDLAKNQPQLVLGALAATGGRGITAALTDESDLEITETYGDNGLRAESAPPQVRLPMDEPTTTALRLVAQFAAPILLGACEPVAAPAATTGDGTDPVPDDEQAGQEGTPPTDIPDDPEKAKKKAATVVLLPVAVLTLGAYAFHQRRKRQQADSNPSTTGSSSGPAPEPDDHEDDEDLVDA